MPTSLGKMVLGVAGGVLCATAMLACGGIPDRSPDETVVALEQATHDQDFEAFKKLFSVAKPSGAREQFMAVFAEEHNRSEEGVLTRKSSSVVKDAASTVTVVYEMKNGVRRTYEWELVREKDRWRLSGWGVTLEGPPIG